MPSQAEALYLEALQDYRDNKSSDAVVKLRRAVEIAPGLEDAYEALSVVLYNQNQYDDAIAVIGKWIAVNKDSAMAQTNLSRCYAAKGMIAEAEHAQTEARRLSWKADLKGKRATLPKIDHDERISRFKQVIEFDPADVLGYYSLATAYQDAGMLREAMETFLKAVEVDSEHTSSYLGLGMSLETLGDSQKAAGIYEKGIKIAEKKGDILPLKKMEARLRILKNNTKS
ncbi:MAG: hypothetical protein A2Z83_07260 [Omnitrophica bacterium GWA2_52_8]|nr:MAG: hypothetical protein A2Z83_07260 [Omnitrophica bacterium GWA2_52_8]